MSADFSPPAAHGRRLTAGGLAIATKAAAGHRLAAGLAHVISVRSAARFSARRAIMIAFEARTSLAALAEEAKALAPPVPAPRKRGGALRYAWLRAPPLAKPSHAESSGCGPLDTRPRMRGGS